MLLSSDIRVQKFEVKAHDCSRGKKLVVGFVFRCIPTAESDRDDSNNSDPCDEFCF